MIFLRTVGVTSVLAHCTVIHSVKDTSKQSYVSVQYSVCIDC